VRHSSSVLKAIQCSISDKFRDFTPWNLPEGGGGSWDYPSCFLLAVGTLFHDSQTIGACDRQAPIYSEKTLFLISNCYCGAYVFRLVLCYSHAHVQSYGFALEFFMFLHQMHPDCLSAIMFVPHDQVAVNLWDLACKVTCTLEDGQWGRNM
jgi:hypothetical protein